MWDDEDDFNEDEFQQEQDRVSNLAIVKKADELYELVTALIETFYMKNKDGDNLPFEDETEEDLSEYYDEDFDEEDIEELDEADVQTFGDHYKTLMLEDVMIISTKLRGAEAGDLYSLRMENAVIIKTRAVSLLTATFSLKMMGLSNNKYLQLLRDEIDVFRILFVQWIQTFDKTKDIPDGWGLFYDSNINYKSFDDDDSD